MDHTHEDQYRRCTCSGARQRLLPATKSQPKEMLPVGRKPVVQYVVEELTRAGMERILFVTGPARPQ
ncbi:MAG: sugar phosphate nucleotidyltransferase [Caldilineaceae bacterium]